MSKNHHHVPANLPLGVPAPEPQHQCPPDFKIWITRDTTRYVEVVATGDPAINSLELLADTEYFYDNGSVPGATTNLVIHGASLVNELPNYNYKTDVASMNMRFTFPRTSPSWSNVPYTPSGQWRLYSFSGTDTGDTHPIGVLLEWTATSSRLVRFTWFKLASASPNMAIASTFSTPATLFVKNSNLGGNSNPNQIETPAPGYDWWHVTQS